jgi:signal transduction histidine kinase
VIHTDLTLATSGADGAVLAPELETAIYRLVQETLTNVVKHARARTVRVLVGSGEDGVVVEVQDDGVGFDTIAPTGGFGLAGVRERVYLAGGKLRLESGAGGTVVRAELPTVRSEGLTNQVAS